MRSSYLIGPNIPLEIRDFPLPEPKPKEVRIKVEYASLNHRDLWTAIGQYRGKSENLILGSDASGIVDALGEDVHNWKLGDKIIINPSLNWGEDENVQGPDFQILGNPDPGTFSEYVIVPSSNIVPKPLHLSMEESAAIPLAGLTAYRALFTRGKLKKGDKLLITGIGGGAAQLALQIGLASGAEVYISSSQDHKIEGAIRAGAKKGFKYSDPNWVQDALKDLPEGFDLILDSASGKGFADLVELCKPGGTLVFFGGTAGSLGPLVPAKVFWRQLNILGTTMGSPREFEDMVHFFELHKIRPKIDSIYPFEKINDALERMKSGQQNGKIILSIG